MDIFHHVKIFSKISKLSHLIFDQTEQFALAFARKYVFIDQAPAPHDTQVPTTISTLLSFPTISVSVSLSLSMVRDTPHQRSFRW